MKKNDVYQVKIEDMTHKGEGLGKVDGFPLFIKDALIGDLVEAKVIKLKKNYGYARLMKVIDPSMNREEAPCPLAKPCGGCQIQSLYYRSQLNFKQKLVYNNLMHIGGFEKEVSELGLPILGMEEPWRYRNKAQYPIGKKDGKIVAGFYAGRTHDIMPCEDCLIGKKENKLILDIIIKHMEKYGIEPYNEETYTGLIRHVLIRCGENTGEWMVCLVINGDVIPKKEALIEELVKAVPGIESISFCENRRHDNVIMGDSYQTIYGNDYIKEKLGDITYRISPLSFFQVNTSQAKRLYDIVVDYANLTGRENVWDLYCGTGSISLYLARHAGHVSGVEIIPAAIEDAKANASLNEISNVDFYVGKAEDVFTNEMLDKEGNRRKDAASIDVVVVDPPRKGCDEKLLSTMLKMEPERIVYVSCDSSTMARDLKILCEEKYQLESWQCVDQFPHTVHVETVCLLSKLHEAFSDDM